jgi:hypothetical protein
VSFFWATATAFAGPWGRWTFGDVLLSVIDTPSWDAFAARLSRGLHAERIARERGIEPDAQALAAASEAFRREGNLLTVEELEAWLASQDLPMRAWESYLVRGVLRAQCHDVIPDDAGDLASSEAFGATFYAEALCSRFLPFARNDFGDHLALAATEIEELPSAVSPRAAALDTRYPWTQGAAARGLARVEAVLAASAARLSRAADPARIEALMRERALDWTRLEGDVLRVVRRDVAEEALLCLFAGEEPAAVALRARVGLASASLLVEDAGPARARLASAVPGRWVGPFEERRGYALYCVRRRIAPNPDDPAIRARAAAILRRREIARAHASSMRAPTR